VTLLRSSVDFGDQTAGTDQRAKTVAFTNNASRRTVNTFSVRLTGTNLGAFAQINNCGTSVAAEVSCTFNVTFAPPRTGTKTTTLNVWDDYRAKLVAQHIAELWRYPSAGFATTAQLYDEFCSALRESGSEELQKFVTNHTHSEIRPELMVQMGSALDSILSLAQAQKADVIVMGTHGGRGYDRLTLGSVTNRVMRAAPCPVLAVCNATRAIRCPK